VKTARVNPLIVLGIGILAVSTASIFIRFAQVYSPSIVIAFYRLAIATVFLIPLVLLKYKNELLSLSRRFLLLALVSGLFLALHFATWIQSLEYTTVASSVVLVSTVPLWVGLLAPLTLKEPLTKKMVYGMVIALAGGIIVGLSDTCSLAGGRLVCPPVGSFLQGEAFLGDLLALIGAFMAAGYLLVGRNMRQDVSITSYAFIVYGFGACFLLVLILLSSQPLIGYPPSAYAWFLLLALVPQLIGHSSFNWALGYVSAALVSISLLGEPVGSTILAFFILGESPGIIELFGAILILVGIYLASTGEQRRNNRVRVSADS